MSRVVYVNGSYVPEDQGKVSIFDRGFLFADGVYEVTAVVGGKLVTIPDIRWARRDIKSVMLLAPVLGKQRAYEQGAFEGWMIEDGKITEGTSSNAYIVKDGRVITRALSNSILAGCTRRMLFRMAKEHGVTIEERLFTPDEAYAADEAFLTSASNFVLP